jgi:hypothetical protein
VTTNYALQTTGAMLSALIWASSATAHECPAFASQKWEFTGHLVNRIFPGPPDFESVSSGDEPLTRWYLQLSSPACFAEYRFVSRFQLILDPEDVARYRKLIGKEIRVTGNLAEGKGAHTTALVVNVTNFALLRRNDGESRPSH